MTHDHPVRAGRGNQLLSRLPQDVFQQISPHLHSIPLRLSQVIYDRYGPQENAYFPVRSILSAIVAMGDGSSIEVGSIGTEGGAGVSMLTGDVVSPHRVIVQMPGRCLRISTRQLRAAANRDGPLRQLLLSYHAAFVAQMSQSAACNGLHPMHQRCCRWLLMAHDRLASDVIPLTHEFLAMLLGVRRAGVTEVLQSLRDRGLVRYSRGKVTVLDRQGLESNACECYEHFGECLRRMVG